MESRPYLRIRFPLSPRPRGVTLSIPGGIERALRQNRLPEGAEAFLPEADTWVVLAEHPAVAAVLSRWVTPRESPVEEDSDPGASQWRRHLQAVQRWAAAL
jgi:hypothetical protein